MPRMKPPGPRAHHWEYLDSRTAHDVITGHRRRCNKCGAEQRANLVPVMGRYIANWQPPAGRCPIVREVTASDKSERSGVSAVPNENGDS